jgi:hypothetical protein
LRLAALLLLSACSVVTGAQTASADLPVQCSRGSSYNPRTGKCVIAVTPHQPERTNPGTRRQSGSQPVASNAAQKCVSSYSGKEVPCGDGDSWWSNARDCYVSLSDPQPAKSDPEWEGHKTGAIYECYSPGIVGVPDVYLQLAGDQPPPSTEPATETLDVHGLVIPSGNVLI